MLPLGAMQQTVTMNLVYSRTVGDAAIVDN